MASRLINRVSNPENSRFRRFSLSLSAGIASFFTPRFQPHDITIIDDLTIQSGTTFDVDQTTGAAAITATLGGDVVVAGTLDNQWLSPASFIKFSGGTDSVTISGGGEVNINQWEIVSGKTVTLSSDGQAGHQC